jgi:hypothetical protein
LINRTIEPIESPGATSSPSELLKRADKARLERRHGEAKRDYLTIRERFAGTRASAVAAFALGRIAFDCDKDYASAAHWFQTYLAEHRGKGLMREALGRLMESRHRAGDVAGASSAARQYLESYPDGPHVVLAKEIIEERRDDRSHR